MAKGVLLGRNEGLDNLPKICEKIITQNITQIFDYQINHLLYYDNNLFYFKICKSVIYKFTMVNNVGRKNSSGCFTQRRTITFYIVWVVCQIRLVILYYII